MFHYPGCELPNVWLESGFQVGEDKFGPYYSVEDIPGLFRAIAFALAHGGGELSAKELRLLRRQLDLTQRDLADKLGRTEQTVLLWERDGGRAIHIPADAARLIKIMVLHHFVPRWSIDTVLHHIDQPRPNRIILSRQNGHWESTINGQLLHTATRGQWISFDARSEFYAAPTTQIRLTEESQLTSRFEEPLKSEDVQWN